GAAAAAAASVAATAAATAWRSRISCASSSSLISALNSARRAREEKGETSAKDIFQQAEETAHAHETHGRKHTTRKGETVTSVTEGALVPEAEKLGRDTDRR